MVAVSFWGKINVSKLEHPLNSEFISTILTKLSPDMSIDFKLEHPANIYLICCILVAFSFVGNFIETKLVHPLNI